MPVKLSIRAARTDCNYKPMPKEASDASCCFDIGDVDYVRAVKEHGNCNIYITFYFKDKYTANINIVGDFASIIGAGRNEVFLDFPEWFMSNKVFILKQSQSKITDVEILKRFISNNPF